MIVKVLIVDDSAFFRRRIKEILNVDKRIEVIGTASNGAEAVELVENLRPDVVTMDIEMPVMDGIAAVKQIMARSPVPILMFSSLTTQGAQATLDALEAGAIDFLPKNFEEISSDKEIGKRQLRARVRLIGVRGLVGSGVAPEVIPGVGGTPALSRAAPLRDIDFDASGYEMLLIGTSTGGPAALQQILPKLPENFSLPIILVQHMPASFTPPFAQRLDSMCRIRVKHAESGDVPRPGLALLAPGGCQTELVNRNGRVVVEIRDGRPDENYKPCVDITFSSAARALSGKAIAMILTGMGADGREGVRALKTKMATIWAQDERSSVVFGMPGAVVEAGLADAVLPLQEIGGILARGA